MSPSQRERLKAKSGPVVEVIKCLAVKLSGNEPMSTDEEIERFIGQAIDKWERDYREWFALSGVTETAVAEKIIETLRQHPKYGWSRILRAGTN